MEKVVIAGGTSGIGLATARLLLKKGYLVTVLGRNQERLDKVLEELGETSNGKAVDAADKNELEKVLSKIGSFNHLVVALSGGKGIGMFKNLDLTDLRKGFDGKFFPQLQTAQSALSYIK